MITDEGSYTTDYLVVALGADYDWNATPGLAEVNEFYTTAGAERLRDVLPNFTRGHALIGVCGTPYKCPPAPSECTAQARQTPLQEPTVDLDRQFAGGFQVKTAPSCGAAGGRRGAPPG